MRHFFLAIAGAAVLLLATGASADRDRAHAADVGPPPGYGGPPDYGPPIEYAPPRVYGPPPYAAPYAVSPPPDYAPPVGYRPRPRVYGPPPYAVSPVRPACDRQWQCGPWGCGWRRVCHPEAYAGSYRGYGPPAGPGYYAPY